MSEDWIAEGAQKVIDGESPAGTDDLGPAIERFGREVAERVRRETLEEAERIVNAVADAADERRKQR